MMDLGDINQFMQMLQHMQNPDNPVDQNILDSLPEFQIEDLSKLPNEKKNCVICLNDFEKSQKALITPCTHLFHSDCIRSWFETQNTCPICKYVIDGESLGQ
jgi:E3 ubiquitin-protein ligase RNF115/126